MTRSVKITIDIDDMPQDSRDALLRRAVDPETAPVISVADPLTGKAAGEKFVAPAKASMPITKATSGGWSSRRKTTLSICCRRDCAYGEPS